MDGIVSDLYARRSFEEGRPPAQFTGQDTGRYESQIVVDQGDDWG
jgi:hypothetical protein